MKKTQYKPVYDPHKLQPSESLQPQTTNHAIDNMTHLHRTLLNFCIWMIRRQSRMAVCWPLLAVGGLSRENMLYLFTFLPTFEQRCSMDGTTKKLTNCQTVAPSMVNPTSVSHIFFHLEIQLPRIVGTGFRIHFMYWIVGGRLFQCLLASWLTLLGGSKRWFYQHISSFFWIDGTTQKTPKSQK